MTEPDDNDNLYKAFMEISPIDELRTAKDEFSEDKEIIF